MISQSCLVCKGIVYALQAPNSRFQIPDTLPLTRSTNLGPQAHRGSSGIVALKTLSALPCRSHLCISCSSLGPRSTHLETKNLGPRSPVTPHTKPTLSVVLIRALSPLHQKRLQKHARRQGNAHQAHQRPWGAPSSCLAQMRAPKNGSTPVTPPATPTGWLER